MGKSKDKFNEERASQLIGPPVPDLARDTKEAIDALVERVRSLELKCENLTKENKLIWERLQDHLIDDHGKQYEKL